MSNTEYPQIIQMLSYAIKKLNELDRSKPVGKTVVQKIIYLANRELNIDLNYTLYHYGPYSSDVMHFLEYSESIGLTDVRWNTAEGYHITQIKEVPVSKNIKEIINKVVEKYGKYTATDLSIIATALYLMDNYETDRNKVVEQVHEIKPKHSTITIKSILEKAGLVN